MDTLEGAMLSQQMKRLKLVVLQWTGQLQLACIRCARCGGRRGGWPLRRSGCASLSYQSIGVLDHLALPDRAAKPWKRLPQEVAEGLQLLGKPLLDKQQPHWLSRSKGTPPYIIMRKRPVPKGKAWRCARLSAQLSAAAEDGDVSTLRACLAEGADPNAPGPGAHTPLFVAASNAQPACVAALLDAGADPAASSRTGQLALHAAANAGCPACIEVLLAAGACPTAAPGRSSWTPLHCAARFGQTDAVQALLRAAPEAALAVDISWCMPIDLAIRNGQVEPARVLLTQGPQLPLAKLAELMWQGGARLVGPFFGELAARRALTAEEWAAAPRDCPGLAAALPAVLARSVQEAELLLEHLPDDDRARLTHVVQAARQPLTAEQWAEVPSPCDGLGTALPAVLERSTEEAALLVRHLPAAQRERLQAAALCLARTGRRQRRRLPALPTPLAWRILALPAAS